VALALGDPFPDLTLESVEGTVRLSERWRDRTLIVAFMRHFGCAFCREHLIDLGKVYDEIEAAGGDVVAVFQYRAEPTRNFCRHRGVPFDCLGDPERDGYREVELGRGERKEFFGAKVVGGWARVARRRVVPGLPQGGDVAQRPGTFVVDMRGRVAYAHYNRDSTDNAPIDEVVGAVSAARAD
jgi:peroxiredoxin